MNRREFIQGLAAAGVVAAVGIDLIQRWEATAIRPALRFQEQYSLERNCFVHRVTINRGKQVACDGMGGAEPLTAEERERFMDDASRLIADFLNKGE